MSQTTISASVARPIRGAGQNGVAYGIVSWLATRYHFTPEQFGLAVLLLGAVVTYLHNLLEDRGIIPALLKAEPPAPDPVPVVDTTVSDASAHAVKKTVKLKAKKDTGLTTFGVVLIVLIVFAAFSLGVAVHPVFLLLLLLIVAVLVL